MNVIVMYFKNKKNSRSGESFFNFPRSTSLTIILSFIFLVSLINFFPIIPQTENVKTIPLNEPKMIQNPPYSAATFLSSYKFGFVTPWDMDIAGNVAYVTYLDGTLQALNISNPKSITMLSSILTPAQLRGIAIDGDFAYLCRPGYGFTSLDISNPLNVVLLNTISIGGGNAWDVVVKGDVAYVAVTGSTAGLYAYDISNPYDIKLLHNIPSDDAYSVEVSGNVAYVADGDSGLLLVNVSNPADLIPLYAFDTAGQSHKVAIDGNVAYVADSSNGLVVVDVSNPLSPVLLDIFGTYSETGESAWGITISGNTAFIAGYQLGLVIVDISNPSNLLLLEVCDVAGSAFNAFIDGDVVYVASTWEFTAFQVMVPVTPTILDTGHYGSSGIGIVIQGNIAYVAMGAVGLVTVDISNPSAITSLDSFTTGGTARGVAIDGHVAYIANDLQQLGGELVAYDVSDPSNIQLLNVYHTVNTSASVAISGDVAYVADNQNGLLAINITDPHNLILLSSKDTGLNYCRGVAVSGNIAYVAAGSDGFKSYNISNPKNMVLLNTLNTVGHAGGVAIDGDVAYVTSYSNYLYSVNISNPLNLQNLHSVPGYNGGEVYGVAVSGDLVLTAERYGVNVYNSSIPDNLVLFDRINIDTGNGVFGVAISGDIAYASAWFTSVTSIRIRNLVNPPSAPILPDILPNPDIDGNIFFDWTDVQGAQSYRVYRHDYPITLANITSATMLTGAITDSNYTDMGLSQGIYWYAIVAVGNTGDSLLSMSKNVTVKFNPAPPMLSQILPNPSSNGNIFLNWSESPLADNYTVYRYTTIITDLNVVSATIIASDLIGLNFTDIGRPEGTWWYAVLACNSTGFSTISNSLSVIVNLPGPNPPFLHPIQPNPNINGTVHLDWDDVPMTTSYIVYRYTAVFTDSNLAQATVLNNNLIESQYDDLNRSNGTWFYAVQAVNATGTSSLSNCMNVSVSLPPNSGDEPKTSFIIGPEVPWILGLALLGVCGLQIQCKSKMKLKILYR